MPPPDFVLPQWQSQAPPPGGLVTPVAAVRPRLAETEYRVEVISDYDTLVRLQPSWDALVAKIDDDHPFLSHAWVCSWWECFGAGHELHILVVKSDSEIVAIAPLMVSQIRIYGLKVRRLGFLLNDHTPRFDFLLSRDCPLAACRALWTALRDQTGQWDLLELRQLVAGAPSSECLSQMARADGYRVGIRHLGDSPYLLLKGKWERYYEQLSRNHRTKIRKGLNRLARQGPVLMEVVSAAEQLTGALDDGLRIEAAAWKEVSGTAIRCQQDIQRFYRVFGERAAHLGTLRLFFLTLSGVRIAFAYALCYRNKLYVLKVGYDPAYARYSPSNLLCYHNFRDSFGRGLYEYEFLGHNDTWKLDWTKTMRAHHELLVFVRGFRTGVLYWAKCRVIPVLQRQPLYIRTRDFLLNRKRHDSQVDKSDKSGEDETST